MKTKSLRRVTYRSVDSHNTPVPLIAIQGKHLSALGFNVGDMFRVSYDQGLVRISTIIKNRYGDPSDYATVAVKR